jgi:redox-sensing transcriptional repressor
MSWVIKQENIRLAILTVAAKDAQSMCDRLVKAGVTGIVNMTNSVLRVPENVKLENLSILNSLKIVS